MVYISAGFENIRKLDRIICIIGINKFALSCIEANKYFYKW